MHMQYLFSCLILKIFKALNDHEYLTWVFLKYNVLHFATLIIEVFTSGSLSIKTVQSCLCLACKWVKHKTL